MTGRKIDRPEGVFLTGSRVRRGGVEVAIARELSSSMEDDEPVQARVRARGENVNTLVDLYSHHQQRIYRYCLALLRNPDDAEDATQETFTRAAPFLPNLPGDLSAYLTTVARNICCDVVRARSRRSVPIDNVPLTDRRVSPERQSVDWDVVRRMWRQLSPSERLLFAYTFAGYKYEEIASRTGMSRPSVSVGLARARRRLRDLAAATGTLALLPLAVRRLLGRLGRRATAAVQSAQGAIVQAADQAGALLVSLLAGTVAMSAAAAAAPAVASAGASHRAGMAASGGPALQPDAATLALRSGTAGGAASLPNRAGHSGGTPPAPPPAALSPAIADLPGTHATPSTTAVFSVASSPDYPSDHTVFVSGSVLNDNCAGGALTCSALFRSTDSGASWSRLAVAGNAAFGRVLLPPSYPADPAFFVMTPGNLEESSTGDGTFDWTVPGASAAAIAPWSTPGHAHLAVLANRAVTFYDAGVATGGGVATPAGEGPVLPPGFVPTALAFAGPANLVVVGLVPSAAHSAYYDSAVTDCPLTGSCPLATALPDGDIGTGPVLSVSPDVVTDKLVTVTTEGHVYVSDDAGATFRPVFGVAPTSSFDVATVGNGPAGPRIVASYVAGTATSQPRVVVSDDRGSTFTDVTGNLDAVTNLISLAAYSDGTLLTGIRGSTTVDTFALRQSTGGGMWVNPS